MSERNLLSGEVLIGHIYDRPTDRPLAVSLVQGSPGSAPRLVFHVGPPKKPRLSSIPPAGVKSWKVVRGSDADLALIREAGFAIADGRDKES